MSGTDLRQLQRQIDRLEHEVSRLREQARPPVRFGVGGGGGRDHKLWGYLNYDALINNTSENDVSVGDYASVAFESGSQHWTQFYECYGKDSTEKPLWALLSNYKESRVADLAAVEAGTWAEGDVIRTTTAPVQCYRIVGGEPVPLSEFVAENEAALQDLLDDGDIPEGAFCRTSSAPLLAYRVIGGKLVRYQESEQLGADRAALTLMVANSEITEGAFCRTSGAIKRAYRYLGEQLICYTNLESS